MEINIKQKKLFIEVKHITVYIRRLKKKDLNSLNYIFEKSFDPADRQRIMLSYYYYFKFAHNKGRIENNKNKNWIAVEYYVLEVKENKKHKIIGTFGIYTISWSSSTAFWLGWTVIHPEYRRRGIGTQCLKLSEEFSKEKGAKLLCVEVSQLKRDTIKFYENNGFRACREPVNDYYGEGDHMLIFWRKL